MDDQLVKDLESLDTSTKTALTKEYNKKHAFNVTGVTRKTGGKSTGSKSAKLDADLTADNDQSDEEDKEEEAVDDDDNGELLDEEQLAELRKGKQLMREAAAKAKQDKGGVSNFEMLQLTGNQPKGAGAKAKSQ